MTGSVKADGVTISNDHVEQTVALESAVMRAFRIQFQHLALCTNAVVKLKDLHVDLSVSEMG